MSGSILGGGQDNELLCGKVPVFARDRSLGPGLRYPGTRYLVSGAVGTWYWFWCWWQYQVQLPLPGIPVSCTAGKIRDWIIAPCLDNDISYLIASRRYHPNHLL